MANQNQAGLIGQSNSTLNSLREAISQAQVSADETMLPQTVYRDAESHGWAHTWNGARRIERAPKVHLSVLPARYFS